MGAFQQVLNVVILGVLYCCSSVCAFRSANKIINGQPASKNDQPFSVYIQYLAEGDSYVVCGGSLIGPIFVLTLAKCVNSSSLSMYNVVAADKRLDREDGEVTYKIKHVIEYPDDDEAASANRIALLVLYDVVDTDRKDIAVVPLSPETPSRRSRCVLSAFGPTTEYVPAKYKQKLDVKTTAFLDCIKAPDFRPDVDMCYTVRRKKDRQRIACMADQGSPIVCMYNGVDVQVAINTEGRCRVRKMTARKLTKYDSWIQEYLTASGCGDLPAVRNGKFDVISGTSVALLVCDEGYVATSSKQIFTVCFPNSETWTSVEPSAGCVKAPEWDGLRVKWDQDPSNGFFNMPREVGTALSTGWVQMKPEEDCTDNPRFRGVRYWKDGDLGVILIFDANGYIAGIQFGIPADIPGGFPSRLVNDPMVLDDGVYYITAYFISPAEVCQGRSLKEWYKYGTGKGLWLQTGPRPERDSIQIPDRKRQIDKTAWTLSPCFPTMGHIATSNIFIVEEDPSAYMNSYSAYRHWVEPLTFRKFVGKLSHTKKELSSAAEVRIRTIAAVGGTHYWLNTTKDMSCDKFFPMFLLYNDEKLNAFGWAFGLNVNETAIVEYPPPEFFGVFLDPVPDCLYDYETVSTQHIFLTKNVLGNNC